MDLGEEAEGHGRLKQLDHAALRQKAPDRLGGRIGADQPARLADALRLELGVQEFGKIQHLEGEAFGERLEIGDGLVVVTGQSETFRGSGVQTIPV